MTIIFHRCRHTDVTWIDSHSCRCGDCHKVGHWFENEGIVMWVQAKNNTAQPSIPMELPATPQPANTVAQNAVA
jgi:hypothetical protein